MKRFLVKILLFCILFFVFEKAFYVFLYISPKLEKDKRLELVLNGDINKDLIVLGSSRGARNIIASHIEDSLNITSYNLSYPGSDIEFHEFLLRSLIIHNKKPKVVLLAVDDQVELLPSESIKFRLDRLYPLSEYDYINNEMIKRGEKTFLSKFLVLARINKRNFDIREKTFSALDTIMQCGSMPISFQRENIEFVFKTYNTSYDIDNELPLKIQAFQNFQELCVSYGIQLFIVYPPNFKNHNISFENRIKELSYPTTSTILYDTTNIIYQNKDYFYDLAHLKTNGAVIFTREIINELRTKVRTHNN